jgi:hypothetical protein
MLLGLISFLKFILYIVKIVLHLFSKIFLFNFYFYLFMDETNSIQSSNLFQSAKIISYIPNNFLMNDEVLPN